MRTWAAVLCSPRPFSRTRPLNAFCWLSRRVAPAAPLLFVYFRHSKNVRRFLSKQPCGPANQPPFSQLHSPLFNWECKGKKIILWFCQVSKLFFNLLIFFKSSRFQLKRTTVTYQVCVLIVGYHFSFWECKGNRFFGLTIFSEVFFKPLC